MQNAPRAVHSRIKLSRTIMKRVTKENSCEIISKFDQRFQRRFFERFFRISLSPYGARSPHSLEPCLWTDQNFENNLLKGSPKEHSCEIISKLDLGFQGRRFLKNFFMSVKCKNLPSMAAIFFDGSQFRERFFEKGHPRNNPVKVFQNLKSDFRGKEFRRISLKCTQ